MSNLFFLKDQAKGQLLSAIRLRFFFKLIRIDINYYHPVLYVRLIFYHKINVDCAQPLHIYFMTIKIEHNIWF